MGHHTAPAPPRFSEGCSENHGQMAFEYMHAEEVAARHSVDKHRNHAPWWQGLKTRPGLASPPSSGPAWLFVTPPLDSL